MLYLTTSLTRKSKFGSRYMPLERVGRGQIAEVLIGILNDEASSLGFSPSLLILTISLEEISNLIELLKE